MKMLKALFDYYKYISESKSAVLIRKTVLFTVGWAMKYEIILLDADDTLLDFKRAERTALVKSLSKNDILINDEQIEIYSRINLSLWKMFEKNEITREKLKTERFSRFLSAINREGDGKIISDCYMNELAKCGFVKDGAMEICEYLSKKCRLFIATNGLTAVQNSRFALSGLNIYIEAMFISEKIGYQKPGAGFFDYIFDYLGDIDKSKILMVGDSVSSDIMGGVNAGIDTCLLDEDGSLKECDLCTYRIADLEELKKIVC